MPVLERFYNAFAQRDWATMGACYHSETRFSDPVFPDLDATGVKAMWKMLLGGDTDLRIDFDVLKETPDAGLVNWDAYYTFSSSGRKVHNRVASSFTIKDGLIWKQRDDFDLWKWSRQALGTSGLLLGWSPLVRNKVRATASARLARSQGNR
ncbi:MAG: nuclear transport factor 2 family protein [Flavobacteriales bacterium]